MKDVNEAAEFMRILSHRGYWQSAEEKNREVAFRRSFALGFGTETDIRDHNGTLVVSHDIPCGGELSCEDLFRLRAEYVSASNPLPLALNVKSDGIQGLLQPLLEAFGIESSFVFDMSLPEQVVYARREFRFFSRQSEYEPTPSMLDRCAGVWLDGFEGTWFDETVVKPHLDAGRCVCIVSPELHRRPHLPFWESMRSWAVLDNPQLMLCTDLPEAARSHFHGN